MIGIVHTKCPAIDDIGSSKNIAPHKSEEKMKMIKQNYKTWYINNSKTMFLVVKKSFVADMAFSMANFHVFDNDQIS